MSSGLLPPGAISFGEVVTKDMLNEDTLNSYQDVLSGEFLVNPINLNYDLKSLRTALSTLDVRVSPAYIVLEHGEGNNPRYLRWLLHLFDVAHMKTLGAGVRHTVTFGDMGVCRVHLAPPSEQERIANFLDEKTARIDALIAEKQALQEVLREETQSCIDIGVLGGVEVEADFPFIPRTQTVDGTVWTRCMLKQRWTVTDCKHLTVDFVDIGVPIASIREVSSNVLDLTAAKMASRLDYEKLIEGNRKPNRGDLIYARNASVGAVAYVDTEEQFSMGQDVCLITSKQEEQLFLRLQLLSSPLKAQLESLLQGATIRRINVEQIRSFSLFVPPPEVQRVVVENVARQLRIRAALQEHCQDHIDRLREYRSSLISAAVTGQLDIGAFKEAA